MACDLMEKIRVFLVDDYELVRRGLTALLSTEEEFEIVGIEADSEQAVEQVSHLHPDVILLDLEMSRKPGTILISEIKAADPQAKILVLTSFGDEDKVFAAVQAGASGYLLKNATLQQHVYAIKNVRSGHLFLGPEIAAKVMKEINRPPPDHQQEKDPLTGRETEILKLVARGLTNNEIAVQLVVSERTVRTHISNILNKLGLANRTQAALYALRKGIARLDEE